jgi:hypothetical protein
MSKGLYARGLAVVLVFWFLASGPIVFAESPRHLDPGNLSGADPLPGEVVALYGELFDAIGEEDYVRALDVLRMGMEVEALPETKLILERYNELLLTQITSLNTSDVYLREAAEYLRYVQTEEADDALLRSISELSTANHTLGLLFEASIQLGNQLGIPQEELLDDLRDASSVLETYYTEYGELDTVKEEKKSLLESKLLDKTVLELSDVSESVLIGDLVYIRGRLSTMNGTGLSREVGFYADGEYMGKAVSDSDGEFYVGFPAPQVYDGSALVWAEYWPSGDDVDVYTPTRSNRRLVDILFQLPSLQLDYSEEAYPGLPYLVSGKLSYQGDPLEGYNISLKSYDHVSYTQTGVDGGFSFNVSVPESVDMFEFTVASMPKGVIGPVEETVVVPVVTYPVNVSVRVSGLNIGGGYLTLSGQVSSAYEGEVEYVVNFQGSPGKYSVVTSGEYLLKVPLSLGVKSGWNRYRLVVRSRAPYVGMMVLTGRYFSLNPLIPLVLVVASSYLYVNRERFLAMRREEDEAEVSEEPAPVPVDPGLGGLELFFYKAGELLGVSLEPTHTIREYLAVLSKRLSERLAESVRSLLLAYERFLYGPCGEMEDLDEMAMELTGRLSDEEQ